MAIFSIIAFMRRLPRLAALAMLAVALAAELLADFLLENQGKKVAFRFRPRAGGKGYSGVVTAMAGPVGGSQGAWMEGSVTLPVDGQPTVLAAVVTP